MDDRLVTLQAFILHRLHTSKNHSAGRTKLKPTKAIEKQLGLTDADVDALLEQLRTDGYLEQTARKGYRLTDAGIAHVQTLPPPPSKPSKAVKPPPPEVDEDSRLVPYQQAFLLLQLLSADGQTLTQGMANKFPRVATTDLELSKPLADQLRRKMAEQGYLNQTKEGRSVMLTLTGKGKAFLATLRHHPAVKLTVSGEALNQLLEAASKTAGATSPDAAEKIETPAPSDPPADLARAVYDIFFDLLRDKYTRDRLVPIFEVRRQVAKQFGPNAATHEALDDHILQLWRDGRVRLISISDMRQAKADELADAIKNSFETLFYMEEADANAGSR